jgi:Glyoxalase-like domain
MRTTLALAVLFITTMTQAQSLNVDHGAICAYDLKSLQDAFAAVNLTAPYGGAHATGGTHNALLGFDDGSYIELIALHEPGTGEGPRWNGLTDGVSRACFWAIHSDNLDADVKKLRAAKIEISDPVANGRTKPDGTILKWKAAAVPDDKGGDILPFMIEDVTPHSARIQPSPSVKGSELTGIKRIVIGVSDLEAAIDLYRRAYGLPAPRTADSKELGAHLAWFAGTPVILAAPASGNSWLAAHLMKFSPAPVALLLGTKDLKKTTQRAPLSETTKWFDQKISWFPAEKLEGVKMGVIVE